MIAEFKIPTGGRVYSKELLKKAVEEYSQRKDKGLVRLTHGEKTGNANLDFSSLFTNVKELDVNDAFLDILKSQKI